MDVTITEYTKLPQNSPQVIIQCRKADDEVIRLKRYIQLFDRKLAAKKITKAALSRHPTCCILNP